MKNEETVAPELSVDERVALVVVGGREAWTSPQMAMALASVLRRGLVEAGNSFSDVTLRLTGEGRKALGLGKP